MRWRVVHRSVGYGHLYRGRFKSFSVQSHEHLLTVARYVERNAVGAALAERAEQWPYGSLARGRTPRTQPGSGPYPPPETAPAQAQVAVALFPLSGGERSAGGLMPNRADHPRRIGVVAKRRQLCELFDRRVDVVHIHRPAADALPGKVSRYELRVRREQAVNPCVIVRGPDPSVRFGAPRVEDLERFAVRRVLADQVVGAAAYDPEGSGAEAWTLPSAQVRPFFC
jgi:hypothetical protein